MSSPKGSKNMKSDSPASAPLPFVVLALSSIFVSHDFNARHASHLKPVSGVGSENGTAEGIVSLAASIEESGQDTAVTVMANPDPKAAKDKPYYLVAGFRRFAALEMIAGRAQHNKVAHPIVTDPTWDSAAPTIRAQVKTLTKSEAMLENLRENTARDDLSGADLAFGVMRYLRTYAAETGKERGGPTEIARSLGKNDSYIMKLINVMKTLPDTITAHWRSSAKPLPVNTMLDLCDEKKFKPEEREEAYKRFCGASADPDKKPEKPTTDERFEAICKSVGAQAEALGRLHEMGHINCDETAWMDRSLLRELGTVKKSVMGDDDKRWLALSKSANDAFKKGRNDIVVEQNKEAQKKQAKEAAKDSKKADAAPTN
jgi:hypothetical protein